jgi:hypothetical protein
MLAKDKPESSLFAMRDGIWHGADARALGFPSLCVLLSIFQLLPSMISCFGEVGGNTRYTHHRESLDDNRNQNAVSTPMI